MTLPSGARAAVVTVSDRCAAGEREDVSGPLCAALLAEQGFDVADVVVVADDQDRIVEALRRAVADGNDVVLTTGGTGLSPRDVTPEATRAVVDRDAPGLVEAMRSDGRREVPTAVLSRGVAGTAGRCLVVNLPGSTGAVRDGLATLAPLLPHVVAQLRADGAGHPVP